MTAHAKDAARRSDVIVEVIEDASDIRPCYLALHDAFTRSNDVIWDILHPRSDTEQGKSRDIKNWTIGLEKARANKRALTFHLKATVPAAAHEEGQIVAGDSHGGTRKIVGYAIWNEASMEYNPPQETLTAIEERYPDDVAAQEYANAVFQRFMTSRREALQALAPSNCKQDAERVAAICNDPSAPPAAGAAMVLELIGVHPDFQGRGVARQLVQWGLDHKARRSKTMDALLEASPMGRHLYARMGFHVRHQISLDDLFEPERQLPDLLFMHTGTPEWPYTWTPYKSAVKSDASIEAVPGLSDAMIGRDAAIDVAAGLAPLADTAARVAAHLEQASRSRAGGNHESQVTLCVWSGIRGIAERTPLYALDRIVALIRLLEESSMDAVKGFASRFYALSRDQHLALSKHYIKNEDDAGLPVLYGEAFEAKLFSAGLIDASQCRWQRLQLVLEDDEPPFKEGLGTTDIALWSQKHAIAPEVAFGCAAVWVLFARERFEFLSNANPSGPQLVKQWPLWKEHFPPVFDVVRARISAVPKQDQSPVAIIALRLGDAAVKSLSGTVR